MNRTAKFAAGAAAAVAVVALSGFGTGAAVGSSLSSSTYQMYANVDAHGDLGSNSGAVKVTRVPSAYEVKFAHPIGSCAAVVQPGKAGGSDGVAPVLSTLVPEGRRTIFVQFTTASGNFATDPFMLTVTCKS